MANDHILPPFFPGKCLNFCAHTHTAFPYSVHTVTLWWGFFTCELHLPDNQSWKAGALVYSYRFPQHLGQVKAQNGFMSLPPSLRLSRPLPPPLYCTYCTTVSLLLARAYAFLISVFPKPSPKEVVSNYLSREILLSSQTCLDNERLQ